MPTAEPVQVEAAPGQALRRFVTRDANEAAAYIAAGPRSAWSSPPGDLMERGRV